MFTAGRLASRHVARALPRGAPTAGRMFHAGTPSRDKAVVVEPAAEGKFVPTPGNIMLKLGLDDWRIALPVGIAAAVPALQQNWIILSEEVQVLACFMAFVGLAHKHGGESIAKGLDDEADAILADINAREDSQMESIRQTIEEHEGKLNVVEDTKALVAFQRETLDREALLKTLEVPHKARGDAVTKLDALVAAEENRLMLARQEMVKNAVEYVSSQVLTDKKLKKTAMDEALIMLADPAKAPATDAVSALFVQFFRDTAKKATAKA